MTERERSSGTSEIPLDADLRPIVALPRPWPPGVAIAGCAAAAALGMFAMLNTQGRSNKSQSGQSGNGLSAFSAPPPLALPAEPQPQASATIVTERLPQLRSAEMLADPIPTAQAESVRQQPFVVAVPPSRPTPEVAYRDAPALIIDGGAEASIIGTVATSGAERTNGDAQSAGQKAASPTADTVAARATLMRNRTTMIPVGALIPAVLETPIDTTRPGLVRAMVSEDAHGFDGRLILVPRGSRLIGEYQSDVRSGQNRVLVTWSRLVRPDGVTIGLGSPAADELGGAGIPGKLNSFFLRRFANAVLQSAMTIGTNLASRGGDSSVFVNLGSATSNATSGSSSSNDVRSKITIKQGAILNVFVARDLDFSDVPAVR